MDDKLSPKTYKYTKEVNSSAYEIEDPNSSFQSQFTTDVASDSLTEGQSASGKSSARSNGKRRGNIKLIPLKIKDLEALFRNIPQYQGKEPVVLNLKENEIDQVIEQQRYKNNLNSVSQQTSQKPQIQVSPISISHLQDYISYKKSSEENSRHTLTSFTEQNATSAQNVNQNHRQSNTQPPFETSNATQVYAMTDIQAYPMVGETGGFRANKSPRRVKRSKSRPRSRHYRSRTRSPRRFRSRSRSRRRRPRKPRRVVIKSRRPPVRKRRIIRSPRYSPSYYVDPPFCNPYPMCDDYCTPMYSFGPQEYMYNRPLIGGSRVPVYSKTMLDHPRRRPIIGEPQYQMTCDCKLCEEKLQFIQPGVCSNKKDMWTNEYAVLPKPQINFIDPCKELDPTIYPRAERPCIRDGRGNPLTDCIGRPLRDPVGKKFLNFSANGSLLDTNVRGNFYTGQPPLCVKCPLPTTSCGPDTTHNWWMSCGYPVKANMGPFLNSVVAAEHLNRRRY